MGMAWRKGSLAAVALAAVTTGGMVLAALHPGDPTALHGKGKRGGVVAVQGARVIRGPLTLTLPLVGHVASTYTVRITPGVAGTVVGVDAHLGQSVHSGQTLFTLTNPVVSLHAQVANANAQAAEARLQQARQGGLPANIAQAKAALTIAEARLHSLFQASPILVQRQVMLLQQAETQEGIAQANLQALQSGEAPQAVSLQNAQQALTTLQAAANGQVGGTSGPAAANLVSAQQALQAVESPQSPQSVALANAQQAYARALSQSRSVTGSVYAGTLANLQQQVNSAQADLTAAIQKAQQAVTSAQAQLQSQLASAQAQVNVTQASHQLALSNAEHALQVAQTNVSAQQANLAALNAGPSPAMAQMAAAAVAAAQARVQAVEHPYTSATLQSMQAAANAAQGNAQLAQITADRLTVKAPVAGKIVAVNPALAQAGATVGAGAALATLQSSVLEVVGPVPQRDRTRVHPGQPAVIYSSAAPKRAIAAHVVGIAPTGNLASLTFQVTVAPDHTSTLLATGEAAQVSLLTKRVAAATLVPTAALQTGSKGSFVYALTPSTARARGARASGSSASAGSSAAARATGSGATTKTTTKTTTERAKSAKAKKTSSKARRGVARTKRAKGALAGKRKTKAGVKAKTLAGTVREVVVRTGYASGSWTQVRSGLKPGTVVLLPGSGSFLAAGDRVAVTMTRVPRPKAFPVRVTAKGLAGTVLSGAAGGTGAAAGPKAAGGKKRGRRKGGKAAKGGKAGKAGKAGGGGGAKAGRVKLGGGGGGGGGGGLKGGGGLGGGAGGVKAGGAGGGKG